MPRTGFENDPHSERGSECPRNVFGTTDYAKLSEIERISSAQRLHELARRGVTGSFDLQHLRDIHRYLFQDVFPWAGQLRLVGMSKGGGAPFAHPSYIVPSLISVLTELQSEGFLRGLAAPPFSQRAAYYLGEINAIHPFREGNGRTQREFIRQLAANAGHVIVWAHISPTENTMASIASHTRKDHRGLATIIQAAIVDPTAE